MKEMTYILNKRTNVSYTRIEHKDRDRKTKKHHSNLFVRIEKVIWKSFPINKFQNNLLKYVEVKPHLLSTPILQSYKEQCIFGTWRKNLRCNDRSYYNFILTKDSITPFKAQKKQIRAY